MDTEVLDVDTARRRTVDLTEQVRSFCAGHRDGLCNTAMPRQSVVLVDLNRDNPRRSVRLSFAGSA